jgi:hypothetical protein
MNKVIRLFFAALIVVETVTATDLRGRVDGIHGYAPKPFPLSGARVTLFLPNPAGGYTSIASAVSGADGMYYFKNIQPGNFVLQVNDTNYPLAVRPVPSQEITPVLLRF